MRIAHVLRRMVSSEWGGIETMVSALAQRQQLGGHEVEIACSSALSRTGSASINGLRIRRFPYRYPLLGLSRNDRLNLDRLGGNPYVPALMRHLEQHYRPEIIHCHVPGRMAAQALAVARRLKVPFLLSLHGGLSAGGDESVPVRETPPGRINWGRLRDPFLAVGSVFSRADGLLPVSLDDAETLSQGGLGERVQHLPNGVDKELVRGGSAAAMRSQLGIPNASTLLLMMARIVPQKDQLLGIRILAELLAQRTNATMVIAGPIADRDYALQVQECAEKLGVAPRLRFLPALRHGGEDFKDLWAAADILLMPSRHEPFGIAALEAWAAEVPVVASRAGGLAHLILDRQLGRSLDSRDPAIYAKAIIEVIQDPVGSAEMTARALAEVDAHYAWDAIARRLELIYEEALSRLAPPLSARRVKAQLAP